MRVQGPFHLSLFSEETSQTIRQLVMIFMFCFFFFLSDTGYLMKMGAALLSSSHCMTDGNEHCLSVEDDFYEI